MNKSSIIDSIRAGYVDENLECSKKINYTDLTEKDGLVTVFYKDLPNTEVQGYPIASDYVAPDGTAYSVAEFDALPEEKKTNCELRFYYLPYYHELYIGTTGSGKTTGCVEPQLRAISSQKNKPNVFITDPKGELFNRNAKHLKDQGYEIFVLNFKDLIRSDRWNPLLELYDTKIKIRDFGRGFKIRTKPVKSKLKRFEPIKKFTESTYVEYSGFAFPDKATFENYVQFERDFLEAKIDSLVNQLSTIIIPVLGERDPSWSYGAQDLLKGIFHCMLEDAVDPTSGFTREMMNFQTVQQYYLALKIPIVDGNTEFYDHRLLKYKSFKPKALMSTALNNAGNTMRSYCGVFDGAIKDWFQGHIFALTTDNTIRLDNIGDKPFAIFLITRDYEKSDFLIAGIFIDWVYKQMLEIAESKKNTRALHFLLDEFGNIPEIKDFENKIATARSRNIWFHLVVQSYKQIDVVYGADRSVIICDNCNAHIFLGAQNRKTKEIFSAECGRHHIPTFSSKLIAQDNSICEVPLIPVSALDQIKPGQMYNKRLYMPVIMSQYIRSYVCAKYGSFRNFTDGNGLIDCTPFRVEPYTAARFTYEKLKYEPNFF